MFDENLPRNTRFLLMVAVARRRHAAGAALSLYLPASAEATQTRCRVVIGKREDRLPSRACARGS